MANKDFYKEIFESNRKWVDERKAGDPDFFQHLAEQQSPDFLYIGCSDSRVHADEIMGLKPGQVFVHRNIANMVINTDFNALSVINYAVEYLKVKYIIVCGHYDCGGIKAAMQHLDYGILNPWLRCIRDVYRLHQEELDLIQDDLLRHKRLVEINTYEQCLNVIKTAEFQRAYYKGCAPLVAAWVYDLNDGVLHDLNFDLENELNRIRRIYDLSKGVK